MLDFEFLINRYLMANAKGLEDGSIKAETHDLICAKFISESFCISEGKAKKLTVYSCGESENLVQMVRSESRKLTDNLDEVIGFPLDKAPNYNRLIPKFKHEFSKLINDFMIENQIYTDSQIEMALKNICKRRFDLALFALESYGFRFIDGQGDRDKERFLKVESKLGQKVNIKPKEYFGCTYELIGISQ